MYCSKCGNEISEQDQFCSNCGNAIDNGILEEDIKKDSIIGDSSSKPSKNISKNVIIVIIIVLIVILGVFVYIKQKGKLSNKEENIVHTENETDNSINDIPNETKEDITKNEEESIEAEEIITNNEKDITLSEDYIGRWTDETEGANEIAIYKITYDKVYFDLGIYRMGQIEDITATIINNDTATFDTTGEDKEQGVAGTLKFENNTVTVNIIKSNWDYVDVGLSFTCDHKMKTKITGIEQAIKDEMIGEDYLFEGVSEETLKRAYYDGNLQMYYDTWEECLSDAENLGILRDDNELD